MFKPQKRGSLRFLITRFLRAVFKRLPQFSHWVHSKSVRVLGLTWQVAAKVAVKQGLVVALKDPFRLTPLGEAMIKLTQ